VSSQEFEECVATIDQAVRSVRRQIVTGLEFERMVVGALINFIDQGIDPRDDLGLLAEYAEHAVVGIAEDPHRADPALAQMVAADLAVVLELPWLRAEADELSGRLLRELSGRERAARDELVELCGHGWDTHRRLLFLSGTATRLLDLAHRFGVVQALHDAVVPGLYRSQIASRWRDRDTYLHGLDLLAHLAASPSAPSGRDAREAMIDLAERIEGAGDVVVRLPVHLLTDNQRSRLTDAFVARSELLCGDPVFVRPTDIDVLRDNESIRSAVWMSVDARRRRTDRWAFT